MVRHWHRNDSIKDLSLRQMLREGEAEKEATGWFLELESGWDCQANTMVYSLYPEEKRVLRTLIDDVQFTSYEFWSFLDFSVCVSSGKIKWKVRYSKLNLKMVLYFRVTFREIETLPMGITRVTVRKYTDKKKSK